MSLPLFLEALAMEQGGFHGLPPHPVGEIVYLHLNAQGSGPSQKTLRGEALQDALAMVRAGLPRLLSAFEEETQPYVASLRNPSPFLEPYLHLARAREESRDLSRIEGARDVTTK